MSPLPYCLHRNVDADGAILCDRIKQGDRAVTPDLCRTCPVATIDCSLLRATLALHSRPPIRIRYGTGRTDIWAGEAPTLTLHQAACSEKIIPIASPHDCSACHLRQSFSQLGVPPSRLRAAPIPAILSAPPAQHSPRPRPAIQLAAYRERSRSVQRAVVPVQASRIAQPSPAAASFVEDKRVGWTD